MRRPLPFVLSALIIFQAGCRTSRPVRTEDIQPASSQASVLKPESEKHWVQAVAPKEFPRIPAAKPEAAWVAGGYRVEVVMRDLTYPTSVTFDGDGNLYIAEAGFAYGDPAAPARIWRVSPKWGLRVVADQLNGPVNDILWHDGRLYISHLGKISVLNADGTVRDLVTGLPVSWDHHNNQLAVGPDGKIYFGVGTATNSGVVGLDNVYPFLWLAFFPDMHDVPARDIELAGVTYVTPDALTVMARQGDLTSTADAVQQLVSPENPLLVRTGAYQPFGKSDAKRIKGNVKSNGTILRMNPDGSGLEVYAWGLRNPFGVVWSPDGQLYVSDLGFDERGSRPIANAPDVIWRIKQDAWYGWPDYAAGVPVTDKRFKSSRGEAPKFLMKNHPPVEKPFLEMTAHASPMKMDFSRSARFGHAGRMFVPQFGSGLPVNAPGDDRVANNVVIVDPKTKKITPFFGLKTEARGPKGYEDTATAGPRRLVQARFSSDGNALYLVDFGAMAAFAAGAGPAVHPFPGTGVVWRVTKADGPRSGPPADLTILPKEE
jgi:glucose/arabinose dehydrogenase